MVTTPARNAPCPCGSGKKFKRCCLPVRSSGKATALTQGSQPDLPGQWYELLLAVLALVGAGCLAYWNSFSGVFLFDDLTQIVENAQIHQIWPIGAVMKGSARPLTDLSLALNYALGGPHPWGYHLVNLMIHLAAGLALFGLIRRTLIHAVFPEEVRRASLWLAFGASLLWLLHPVQTASVTYIVQRAESLMGLCYLLTLYCAVRWMDWGGARWLWMSVACCAMGMASKSIMVTAPLLVALYDWIFMAESGRRYRFSRLPLYLGLAATWLLLLVFFSLIFQVGVGVVLEFKDVSLMQYAASQPGVILHYLKLAVWPDPLVFDYAWPVAHGARIFVPLFVLLLLIAATCIGLRRRAAWAFLGAWFLIILLPTSLVLLRDLAFEHRMYLSLAAIVVLFVVGTYELLLRSGMTRRARHCVIGSLILLSAVAEGTLTARRNAIYHNEFKMWSDVAAKRPENARAHNNLCMALQKEGKTDEAALHCIEALRLRPNYEKAHYNMALVCKDQGKIDEAASHYREAIRYYPDYFKAYNNLGLILQEKGSLAEAESCYRKALELWPNFAEAHLNLGHVLVLLGREDEAGVHLNEGRRLQLDRTR